MTLPRRLCAEWLGSALLAAAVIGSGIMAQRLTHDAAVALLANTAATVAALATLIALFAPVSGAHFNPAVSLVFAMRGRLSWRDAGAYGTAQVLGCVAGAMLAHLMFELPLVTLSTHVRTGLSQGLSEVLATAGLVLVILGVRREASAPWMIAAWIGAAYWFTASTSFANPAITIARVLSDTFAGIRPADAPLFVAAQLLGAMLGAVLADRVLETAERRRHDAGSSTSLDVQND